MPLTRSGLEEVEAKVVIMRRMEQEGGSAGAANALSMGLDLWISSCTFRLALHVARTSGLSSKAELETLLLVGGAVYFSYMCSTLSYSCVTDEMLSLSRLVAGAGDKHDDRAELASDILTVNVVGILR